MKKGKLHRIIHDQDVRIDNAREEADELRQLLRTSQAEAKRLADELAQMKANWRPVPIQHEWQPKNPQCALCDEPRDSRRHVAENVIPAS